MPYWANGMGDFKLPFLEAGWERFSDKAMKREIKSAANANDQFYAQYWASYDEPISHFPLWLRSGLKLMSSRRQPFAIEGEDCARCGIDWKDRLKGWSLCSARASHRLAPTETEVRFLRRCGGFWLCRFVPRGGLGLGVRSGRMRLLGGRWGVGGLGIR